ncbi:acyclic terpene utilization AtuA family protein [Pseudonocardia pini]|uniref:acyclic terpene utilization AtuA family protein n=1 Tax=Pseudonocardia pini TaxID=2758030 RepID=UPI0015EFF9D4|nr:acyclic terpene utilization AtuA family protein [Pseudonocardia pini]
MTGPTTAGVRIGSFAAFYGDRRGALARFRDEQVDVLVGDYLAELTMLVLKKNMLRGKPGYATGFVDQLRPELTWIAEQGVKVVVNAGGLDPVGCAAEVERLCREQGLALRVAAVTGDDLTGSVSELRAAGHTFTNIDTAADLEIDTDQVLTANAYLGAWPIVAALRAGADIVIAPRVTDAALVMAPPAWHFGWSESDYDRLAGALAAGHAIECGAQATGGNFCFFAEHGDLGIPGMPIAEIREDGSSVITKTSGSGGLVTVDTVTAQMLYEVSGPDYHNPDVIVDWRTVRIDPEGLDRVLVHGVEGRAPTGVTKLSLSYEGGYRNSMTVGLTGPDKAAKIAWIERQFAEYVGAPADFDELRVSVVGSLAADAPSYEAASAWMTIAARDTDRARVSRANFSDRIVELGVSSIPGCYFTTPPLPERLVGVQWPCLVPKSAIRPAMVLDGRAVEIPWGPVAEAEALPIHRAQVRSDEGGHDGREAVELVPVMFGDILGARSGDKAGAANLGVWVREQTTYDWLRSWLTVSRLRELLPELAELEVVRHEFPLMRGMNFMVYGFLGQGVSACLRIDPQAKGLGEYLRAKQVAVPADLLSVAPEPRAAVAVGGAS